MLTKEENDLLTQTGPGTLGGALLRRYWQPVALSEELPPGGAPLPVRILSEDLALFRAEDGQPGLLGLHCPHRGADLSYGRLEDGGLRCLYHGWLFNRAGRCLEQPGEPAGSTFYERIQHTAYPCREAGGMILTYLGPGEPPPLPNYGCFSVPPDQVAPTKLFHDCNYLQGNEGNIDLVHVSLMHLTKNDVQARVVEQSDSISGRGGAPNLETIEVDPTPTGFRYCKLRQLPSGERYVRSAEFVIPNSCAVPARQHDGMGYLINWHVPIDDLTHWKYIIIFNWEHPLDRETVRRERYSYVTADYQSTRNKANRYLQDRAEMRTESYTGMGLDLTPHDVFATEGQGPIQDRTHERLAPSDMAVAQERRLLLNLIRDVQAGVRPPQFDPDPALGRPRKIVSLYDTLPASTDWAAHCRERE
jgi:phenylpropionate dioxygenase-like ring-hydroxylating dioxygenase large terminal subunit